MRISTLGSGSKGNATLIHVLDTVIMVDCGFGLREAEKRLQDLGLKASDITAILVTHEHQDHIHGVASIAAKYDIPVFISQGSARTWSGRDRVAVRQISAGQSFSVGDIKVLPVAVPHDAREPVQFVFNFGDYKIGILTDLGSITPHVVQAYEGCCALLVEANHDLQMLQKGPYPVALKRRVAGKWGHLNNLQTAEFVSRVNASSTLRNLIVAHISEQNNQVDLVARVLEPHIGDVDNLVFASQSKPLDWIELD